MLALLMVVALVAIGAGALVAPRPASAQYGIPVDDPRALALIRAMGVRDLVIGVVLALLMLARERHLLAWAMGATALVALADFAVVIAHRRRVDRAVLLHAAGGVGVLVTGLVLGAGF